MWSHATHVWPAVQRGMADESKSTGLADVLTTATAMESRMATPEAVWTFSAARLPDGSRDLWLGLAPFPDRHLYFIPVLAKGQPVGTLATQDYGGVWSVWPDRNYAAIAASATVDLDRYFGTHDYQTRFVEDGGVWYLARRGDDYAGVFIEPWGGDLRVGQPPVGVASGTKLAWWLVHPMGR